MSGAVTAWRCASLSGARMWETSMGRPRILQDRQGVAYSTSPLMPFDGVHTRWLRRCTGECLFSSRVPRSARSVSPADRSLQRPRQPRRPAAATAGTSAATAAAWDGHVTQFIEASFAANPVSASYAGRHEFDGKLPDLTAPALRRDVGRLETARARHAGVRSGRPYAGAAARARLSAGRDRGRTLLGERSRMAVPQPGVLPRLPRSGDLPQQALRAARDAHARLHRLCA